VKKIKGIVFDLDGTLADTFEDIASSVNHVRDTLGLPPLSLHEVKRHVGKGVSHLIQNTTGASDPRQLKEAVSVFRKFYLEHLLDSTRLYDGVMQGLDMLYSRSISMAVLSNKPEDATKKIVEGLGIARFFMGVFGGDSFEKQKPAKESLLGALNALKVDPWHALMVGDSLIDIETAENAGTICAIVTTGLLGDLDSVKGRVLLVAHDIFTLAKGLEHLNLI